MSFNDWAVSVIEGNKEADDFTVNSEEQSVTFWYAYPSTEEETIYWKDWK